jgi:hypothetical protein
MSTPSARLLLCLGALSLGCSDHGFEPWADAGPSPTWAAEGAVPVVGPLLLSATDLVQGEATTMTATGAGEGETVHFVRGTEPGAGPCLDVLGGMCVLVTSPKVMGTAVADAAGTATFELSVPAWLAEGTTLGAQALAIRGIGGSDTIASEPILLEVRDSSCDNGLLDAGEVDVDCGGVCDACPLWYEDLDGDGFGDPRTALPDLAVGPEGYVAAGGDCDDSDEYSYPGAPEWCDGVANDCDDAGWTPAREDGLASWQHEGIERRYAGFDSIPHWGSGTLTICAGTFGKFYTPDNGFTVIGLYGAEATIIDLGGMSLSFWDGRNDSLSGLTFTGGDGLAFGNHKGTVTLSDVIIEGNTKAIDLDANYDDVSATIQSSVIRDNDVGIVVRASAGFSAWLDVRDSVVENNLGTAVNLGWGDVAGACTNSTLAGNGGNGVTLDSSPNFVADRCDFGIYPLNHNEGADIEWDGVPHDYVGVVSVACDSDGCI